MKFIKTLSFVGLIAVFSFLLGCGGGDGGASEWAKPGTVTVYSSIRGQVLPPVAGASFESARPAFSLLSVEGAEVYIEEKPELKTRVASQGTFLLSNVPAGKYHLIAQTVVGTTAYRQRTDQIHLTGQFEIQELPAPLPLNVAPHRVKLKISDLVSGSVITGARVRAWGLDYLAGANGDVEIGPLTNGFWPVTIEAAGYRNVLLHIGFQEQRKAELYIKLTPLASTDKNRAPLIEIEQSFKTIRANDSVNLFASGFDPDGDQISYTWSATRGSFLQNTGSTVVFNAPPSSGTAEITLAGKDSKGAEARARLSIEILPGSNVPVNPANRAPAAATSPFPTNLSTGMDTDIVFRWTGSDPDNDPLTYDFYLATQGADLKLLAQNLPAASYRVGNLRSEQVYFWRVISRDIYEAISPEPPLWQFTTGDGNNSTPNQPGNPVPEDLSIDQLPSLRFSWTGGDPDVNDVVTYSFYIGLDSDSLELTGQTRNTTFEMENLQLGKTYYWRIIAADSRGRESLSPLWRFSTYAPPNQPPSDPIIAYPADGAVNVPIDVQLRWEASDPDGDAIKYDLYIGTATPLLKVASDFSGPSYIPASYYKNLTKYFWQVVVRDSGGLENLNSPVWSFTTTDKTNISPSIPVAVSPANNAVNVALQPVFTWQGGDPDGDAVTYDLYLDDTELPVTLRASSLSEARWVMTSDLEINTRYYWRIIAKDPSGAQTQSPVFSFTTRSAADSVPPVILSVTPADGSSSVSQSSEVRIVFSEPVEKATVLAAVSFSPSIQGSWTWENDSTVVFFPAIPWLPGSYNSLMVADGVVKDLAGLVMATGGKYRFTAYSAAPLPAGFRSSGFPISASSGQTVKVSVPALNSSSRSYVVAAASPGSADVTVRGSQLAGNQGEITDPSSAFRIFERMAANRSFPEVMSSSGLRASIQPSAAPQVGVSESFYIPAFGSVATSTAYPANIIQATCLGLSEFTAIYVDNKITAPSSSIIAEVRKRFEDVIRPRIREYFGNEPSVGPDGDARVTILLTDSMAIGIAGIFYGVDLFSRDPSDIQLRESNGRKMFYLKYSLTSDTTRYGTIAHEFQHMVNFWQKRYYGGNNTFEETWLNEGLSKYAEEVCGYGILQGDQNTALLIKKSQENFNSLSVTNWTGENSYGLSYLFLRYIAQEGRYGTTNKEVTRKLVNSSLVGVANVSSVTGEVFDVTLGRWGTSLFINNHASTSGQAYGFSGLNLAGSYAGVTLPGFTTTAVALGGTVNLSFIPGMVKCYEKVSNGSASTEMEFTTSSAMKLWSWDQRP